MKKLVTAIVLIGLFGGKYGLAQTTQPTPLDASLAQVQIGAQSLFNAATAAGAANTQLVTQNAVLGAQNATLATQHAADLATIAAQQKVIAALTPPAPTFTTIQAAIDATPSGGSITIPNGTYNETPNLGTKVLTLVAQTAGGVTINSGGKPYTFTGPPGCTIAGIKFVGSVFMTAATATTPAAPASHQFAAQTNSNWTMTDCWATSNSGGFLIKGDGIKFVRCNGSGNGQNGIGGGCTNTTLTDCVSTGNNTLNFAVGGEAGGGKFVGCNNLTFTNYNCSGNNGVGLWLDSSNLAVTINGGTFSNNKFGTQGGVSPGIQIEISKGPIVVNGATLAGNNNGTAGLMVCESGGGGAVTITNNTFTNNQLGFRNHIDSKTGKPRAPGLGNVKVSGNTFNGTQFYGPSGANAAAMQALGMTIDNDTYVQTAGNAALAYIGSETVTTLPRLQALGFEGHGTVTGLVVVPPPAPTPPLVSSQPVAFFGTNTASGEAALPQTIPTLQHFGMKYVRYFGWGAFTQPPLPALWVDSLAYSKVGIKPVVCLNFNNSVPANTSPAQADWVKYLSAIPPPVQTGVWGFEVGNELGVPGGYSGNATQYAATLADAYNILHAKGYVVICANVYYGSPWPNDLVKAGALKYCDYVGRHAYDIDAGTALVDYGKIVTWAAANNKPVCCTEVGLHADPKKLPQWAAETQKLYSGLKPLGGIYIQFPLYVTTTKAGPQGLLVANGQPNQPFYSAAEAAFLGN